MNFNKICVIGLGYIGLPTAAMFASRKIKVVGVDINPETVETINQGKIHIIEPDLDMVVHAAVTEGYLKAKITPEASDAFLIAVPTPFIDETNHEPDLSYIKSAVDSFAPYLVPGNLVILESTSPVGTTEKISKWLGNLRPDLLLPHNAGEKANIKIAHCPERVLPGKIMKELIENSRIVGGVSSLCCEAAYELYKKFVKGKFSFTNARTAELTKLVENSYRDVNIAFANELSIICNQLDINVWDLIALANNHPRVNILNPGPGVGGHCLAVDPWFIIDAVPEQAKLIKLSRKVNKNKEKWVANKICTFLESKFNKDEDITVTFFGVSFKPNIDDLRQSPALRIIKEITEKFSYRFKIAEPNITKLPDEISDKVQLVNAGSEDFRTDIAIILVKHNEFLDNENLSNITNDCIVDFCGLL